MQRHDIHTTFHDTQACVP